MPSITSLADLPAGHSALIGGMATGNPALTRLRELGVSPGTLVRVVRRAPLGDPIEICVRGSRLAMRNREAAFIQLASHE